MVDIFETEDGIEITPQTIVSCKQNHPEIVVQDAKEEFNLTDGEAGILRFILMKRGVNKWLYCRTKFIDLKHDVKEKLKESEPGTEKYELLQELNIRMQNIAKTPRWVEWPKNISNQGRKRDVQKVRITGSQM